MFIRTLPLALVTLALPVGCVAPWPALETCPEEGCPASSTETSGGEQVTAGITITATSPTDDSSTSTSSGGDATSTGEALPPAPPSIVDLKLSPTTIHHNGPITVEVTAVAAEGVRLLIGDVVAELAPIGEADDATIFVGEIAVYSGLDKGEHAVTAIAWRGDDEGEPVHASYHNALPEAGSEGFFEAGDQIGAGAVAALGVVQAGVIELGTRSVGGKPRCYIRRRDKAGAWFDADVIDLLGGDPCVAIDLKVRDDGALFVLLQDIDVDNNTAVWWLGELAAWGAPAKNIRQGAVGETAAALAMNEDVVAVCGSVPNEESDGKDAAAWIFEAGELGKMRALDYKGSGNDAHEFAETTRDCVFAGDVLVMVGEAFGRHPDDPQYERDRDFILRFNLATEDEGWKVGSGAIGLQSGATAVAIDDEGRVLTAGYYCGDDCDPDGVLQVHDEDGPLWSVALGAWPSKAYGAHDLVWSPAGYAILAAGGTKGHDDEFSVRAFAPLNVTPLWTYTRADADAKHMARALAVGAFGEVYAGGYGGTNDPAIAYIGG